MLEGFTLDTSHTALHVAQQNEVLHCFKYPVPISTPTSNFSGILVLRISMATSKACRYHISDSA